MHAHRLLEWQHDGTPRPAKLRRSGGFTVTLRLPLPINRALILQGLALLAFAVVVGIFMHSIISLLAG